MNIFHGFKKLISAFFLNLTERKEVHSATKTINSLKHVKGMSFYDG